MPHLRCRLVSTNTAPDQQQLTSTRIHTHMKRLQTLYGLLSSACSSTRAVTKTSSHMYTTLPYTACHFQGFHHSGVHSNYERVGFLHRLLHIFPLLAFVGYQVACYRAYRRQTGAFIPRKQVAVRRPSRFLDSPCSWLRYPSNGTACRILPSDTLYQTSRHTTTLGQWGLALYRQSLTATSSVLAA
jgi:hypothetical protein